MSSHPIQVETLRRIYVSRIEQELTTPLFITPAPDDRSRARKLWDTFRWRAYWYSIGWFRAWLHRDCGENW